MFGPIIWIVGIICAVWVIYDVVVNQKKMEPLKKGLWIVAALIFSIITAVAYYLVVKKK